MAPVNRIAGHWLSPVEARQRERPSGLSTAAHHARRAPEREAIETRRPWPTVPPRQVDAETHRLAGPVATLVGSVALGVSGLAASVCGLAVWAGYLATPTAALGLAIVGSAVAAAATLIGYGAMVSVAVASSQLDD